MLKKIFIAFALITGFAGCQSKTALDYSQSLVKKEQSIIPEMTSTEEKVKMYFASEHFDSVAVAGERMEKLVDEKLKEIKDQPTPDVKGATAFKDAFINYFKFIKSLYAGYKNIGQATTAEARDQEIIKISKLVDQKETVLKDIQDAQKKFATENNFRLEEK